jgi:hypothetical protein
MVVRCACELPGARQVMNKACLSVFALVAVGGLLAAGCAAPTDGGSDEETTDSTEDGLTSDPAKDKRCFADLYLGTTRLSHAVEAALGTRAFCKESNAKTLTKGTEYYYGAGVSCPLAGKPDAAKVAAFTSSMAAQGFHGWSLSSAGGALTAVGGTSTQLCSAYPGASAHAAVSAAKDRACFADLFAVERVERVVSKAANAGALCTISSPREIGLPGSYYYLGDIECTVVTSCSTTTADIVKNLNAAGYHGYASLDRGNDLVVAGQWTTRDCKSYGAAPRPPRAAAN